MTKYGIPYQGSKSKLAEKISANFPKADNFYDIFGGGFSMTHFLLENNKQGYKNFYFNEIRNGVCDLIKDAIAGKFNYDVFKPNWIDKETFKKNKDSCSYTKMIWSFGNNGKDYLFGDKIADLKKEAHNAVVFNIFSDKFVELFGFSEWLDVLSIKEKRLLLRKKIRELSDRRFELQQLEQLQLPEFTSLDYRDIEIKENSIVYCDPPYKNTKGYDKSFDHCVFLEWASFQKNPVFISEYSINDNRFELIAEFEHRSIFSAKKNNKVIEKLYWNKK